MLVSDKGMSYYDVSRGFPMVGLRSMAQFGERTCFE